MGEVVMSYPFKKTDSGRSESKRPKQQNDCTVRALVNVTGVPYDTAYEFLTTRGRKCGRGAHFPKRAADDSAFGFRFVWRAFPARKGERRMNPATFAQEFKTGTWVVKTARHVFAFVNGTALDTFPEPSDRCIYGAWEIVPTEEVEAEARRLAREWLALWEEPKPWEEFTAQAVRRLFRQEWLRRFSKPTPKG
jgi:hypothetical protein